VPAMGKHSHTEKLGINGVTPTEKSRCVSVPMVGGCMPPLLRLGSICKVARKNYENWRGSDSIDPGLIACTSPPRTRGNDRDTKSISH